MLKHSRAPTHTHMRVVVKEVVKLDDCALRLLGSLFLHCFYMCTQCCTCVCVPVTVYYTLFGFRACMFVYQLYFSPVDKGHNWNLNGIKRSCPQPVFRVFVVQAVLPRCTVLMFAP